MNLHESGRAIFFGTLVFILAWAGAWLASLLAGSFLGWVYIGSILLTTASGAGAGWFVNRWRLRHADSEQPISK